MAFASPPSNSTSFFEIMTSINSDTGNYFGFLILLSIFAIMFISMKNQTFEKSFGASSFITLIMAIFFYNLNLINGNILAASLVLGAIGIFLLVYESASSK